MNESRQPDPADLIAIGLAETRSTGAAAWQPPAPEALTGLPNLEPLALIGCGGMGAVYRARQTHLDRLVALKVLPPERGRDAAFVERFTREARAMARLQHPHIVSLYDFGRSGEWLYLEMELIEGATLREVMRTGRLGTAEVLRIIPQLCDALAHAHAAGVVHRDLKPENILIDGQGRAVITDFGLAKLRDDAPAEGTALTGSGTMLGTAHYMAPEQVAGAASVDHRADLYALGVIIYELLTGNLPLGRFQPPSQASGMDARVDAVVMKSLEREPGERWQSAAEVRRAVEGLDRPAPVPVPVAVVPVAAPVAAIAPVAPAPGGPTPAWKASLHRLARDPALGWFGGVCAGFARWADLPPWVVRLGLAVAFCLVHDVGFVVCLAYITLWIFLPHEATPVSRVPDDGVWTQEDLRIFYWLGRCIRRVWWIVVVIIIVLVAWALLESPRSKGASTHHEWRGECEMAPERPR